MREDPKPPRQPRACGTWPSPVSAESVAQNAARILGITVHDGDVVVAESRPRENGRVTLLLGPGDYKEILPAPYSARSRVHEYGGGAFTVFRHQIYFVNNEDQRIYRVAEPPVPLTAESDTRFADLMVDATRGRLVCVGERKRPGADPENFLCAVPLAGGSIEILARGADFYASPRISPDGQRLAYLSWNHPNMPWDGCLLHLCDLDKQGYPANDQVVAGGEAECIFQPDFSPTGVLHFISDRSGFGNLYRRDDNGTTTCLWELEADFHQPQWVFGQSTYAFHDEQTIVCAYSHDGQQRLGIVRHASPPSHSPLPLTDIPTLVGDGKGNTYYLGAAHHLPPALYAYSPQAGALKHHHGPKMASLPLEAITRGRAITFPTTGEHVAHGFFYSPQNPDYQALDHERPPLMVICHGGPTGAASTAFSLAVHFWTTRGFAVLDVNYRGSTGFGRAYQDALAGQWGVLDVDDCVAGARFLVAAGDVDPDRMVIRGGSAGGLTVLSALAHHRVFRAGASYYGVCDLESLAKDTHKFESRYLDRLVGPYPAESATYQARSPLRHADKIDVPVIFFHGTKDPVVPIDQAERMVKALAARGIPAPMHTFPDESHGFRSAATIATALQAELDFYLGVFSGDIAKRTG